MDSMYLSLSEEQLIEAQIVRLHTICSKGHSPNFSLQPDRQSINDSKCHTNKAVEVKEWKTDDTDHSRNHHSIVAAEICRQDSCCLPKQCELHSRVASCFAACHHSQVATNQQQQNVDDQPDHSLQLIILAYDFQWLQGKSSIWQGK